MEILKVFDLDKEADAIEAAVSKVLKDGYRTIDIMSDGKIIQKQRMKQWKKLRHLCCLPKTF